MLSVVLVPPVSLNETIEALVHGTNITTPFSNLTDSYNVTQFEQLLMTLNSTNSTAFDLYTNMTNVTSNKKKKKNLKIFILAGHLLCTN